MTHSNHQPGRLGLTDARIAAQKAAAIEATMKHGEAKRSVMTALYGACGDAQQAVMNRIATMNDAIADYQRGRMNYSDKGDFTNVYRGGFY
ncbi:MAG: hypothetical protein ACOH2R_17530 [Pseudomonas sp.]